MTPFQKWYEANKAEFNRKRAERRDNDPAYKAKQKAYRKKSDKPDPVNGLTLNQFADELEVSIWVIIGWRTKKYIPEPAKYRGMYWYHRGNVDLARVLRQWLGTVGPRVPESRKSDLEDMVNWTHANWTTLET